MKTTKLIIVMGIVLIFSQSFAQDPTKGINQPIFASHEASEGTNQNTLTSGGSSSTKSKIEGTTGNAYLNGDWQEGTITMKDNTVITGNKYRYNIYTQQMQFISNEDTMALANPEATKSIQFADRVFVYTNFYSQGELKQGYFELLNEGECCLLKRWVVSYHLVEGEAYQSSMASGNDAFIRECACFLKFGNNPAIALEHRKKDFLNCFEEDSDHMGAYMKIGKLKHKDQEDLVEIVSYYNHINQ